jgi:hypothetical protein
MPYKPGANSLLKDQIFLKRQLLSSPLPKIAAFLQNRKLMSKTKASFGLKFL